MSLFISHLSTCNLVYLYLTFLFFLLIKHCHAVAGYTDVVLHDWDTLHDTLANDAVDVVARLPPVHLPDCTFIADNNDIYLDVGWGDPEHFGHSNLA